MQRLDSDMSAVGAGGGGGGVRERFAIRVRGLVQGVGFRPHVYRTARAHGVSGFVKNDQDGVLIEAEGERLGAFLAALEAGAPPLADIQSLDVSPRQTLGPAASAFEILESAVDGPLGAAVAADAATCRECLTELFTPGARRHLHPFICCTNCGPRFTITRALPYDRAQTTMAGFAMCADCAAEYADPADRRFHAEPIACPACGPRLDMPVAEMAERLRRSEILALKGLGGFHLMCDARDEAAVARLRARKRRDGKPFAVMTLNAASAARLAQLDAVETALLASPERPVVVARAAGASLAPSVSNGLPTLGLMLAYAPVHHLLFHALLGAPEGLDWLDAPNPLALVATSANLSGDALVKDEDEARAALEDVADAVSGHDRAILVRADDSVARVIGGAPSLIRRARGYAPKPIPFAPGGAPVLALGAHLKATITLTRGDDAFVSQHIGDLSSASTRAFLAETARHLEEIAATRPARLACDLHPDFASTRLAESLAEARGLPLFRVQHHHAHIAAVAAEHGAQGPLIGLALDGYGMGADGGAWGGELLQVDGAQCLRLGALAGLPLPGGEAAAREPWRAAAGALHLIGRGDEIPARFCDEAQAPNVARLLAADLAPRTSAAGRWFDAAAGLLGLLRRQSFEGEAPMRLEALVGDAARDAGGWRIDETGALRLEPLFETLADCADVAEGARLFHGGLIAGLAAWSQNAAERAGLRAIALGGGCFLNKILTEGLTARLSAAGFEVLTPRRLPPGDGAVSYGQAVVAAGSAS